MKAVIGVAAAGILLTAAFLWLLPASQPVAIAEAPKAVQATDRAVIQTATGSHSFTIEFVNTPSERSKGLMYRPSMPEDNGMLFDFGIDDEVSMWMRNTPMSLDMVFIKDDGRVHRIARDTTPYSEKIIPSRGPVRAVLELVAGTAKRIGLQPGDRIDHPMFGANQ